MRGEKGKIEMAKQRRRRKERKEDTERAISFLLLLLLFPYYPRLFTALPLSSPRRTIHPSTQ